MHGNGKRRSLKRFSAVCAFLLFTLVGVARQRVGPTTDLTASRAREEAAREKWQRVSEIFSLAGIAPGQKVADVGAGGGFLTIRLARAVGPTGHVFAVDIAPLAVQTIRDRAREEGLDNVEAIEGAKDDPRLPQDALDAVIILYAYHEMDAHEAMLRHIRESLKPTGRLVLIEPTSRLVAPDRAAQRRADVLSAQLAEEDLRNAQFQVAELRDPFATELFGRSLQWLIVAHRSPGILLSRIVPSGAKPATADGREVVAPPGRDDDMARADLRLSVDEVRKRMDVRDATVVDLRSDAEYRQGHIRGAVSVLPGELDAKLSAIASRQGPVFIYCG